MSLPFGQDMFRIFCFFDDKKLIILAKGFQKKTQKTPKKEIDKALKIKEEYFNVKEVRISTLQRIVELGLGGQIQLSIKL